MPIDVTCPGCKVRFQVSDKFAGKKGPCPKCKVVITVPEKAEEVKIHAPEVAGPKDSKGGQVIKPITRKTTRFSPLVVGAVVGAIVLTLGGAVYARMAYPVEAKAKPVPGKKVEKQVAPVPTPFLALGALLLAPPLCWAGYQMLRDDELEAYRGRELGLRIAICSATYAVLWGVYFLIKMMLLGGQPPETFMMLVIIPPLVLVGGAVGFGCFSLNFGTGVMHYGLYLLVTVLMRLVANVGPL